MIALEKSYWCAVIDAVHEMDASSAEITAELVAAECLHAVQVPDGRTEKDAFQSLKRMASAYLAYRWGGAE